MTLALLESIIFNRLTGPQSSPLTPATSLHSLGLGKLEVMWAIRSEDAGSFSGPLPEYTPDYVVWLTLQDVLNSFPEPDTGSREAGNP